ncbi:MAG: hypothetical protein HQM00_02175 [Magnetococcales bacterium]|nr:hypothetical protein [Magnetococcales bacterium]
MNADESKRKWASARQKSMKYTTMPVKKANRKEATGSDILFIAGLRKGQPSVQTSFHPWTKKPIFYLHFPQIQ